MTTSSRARQHTDRARRVVFLPEWHDNPYQDLLASGLTRLGVRVAIVSRRLVFFRAVTRQGRPDVLHLHAPDHFVVYRRTLPAAVIALALYLAQIAWLRWLGVRVVWTVHDLTNHEGRRPRFDAACRRATARLADALIVHCQRARDEVARGYGVEATRIHVVRHGHYGDAYPHYHGDRTSARAALDLPRDSTLVLFLGNIRRHKGVERLIDAFRHLDRAGARLVIAGDPFDAGIRAGLAASVQGRSDVVLRLGRVADDDVPVYLRAADLVVCPFTSSLTSGSLALALSFGKAVVVSRQGCAAEMVGEDGGFLYDPSQSDGLVSALRAALDARDRLAATGQSNAVRMRSDDWHTLARQTLAVYDEAASNG